jgi:hypothetical protein
MKPQACRILLFLPQYSNSNNSKNLLNTQHHPSNSNIMIHTQTEQMQLLTIKVLMSRRSQSRRSSRISSTHLMTTMMRIQVTRKWLPLRSKPICLLLIKFHKSQRPSNNKLTSLLPNSSSSSNISLLLRRQSNNCPLFSRSRSKLHLRKKD